MFLIRTAEQEIANLYLKEKIMSFVHFYIGQEAVAVGVCDSLSPDDKVLGNHRSHGHYLARGGDLKKMISELLGRANGCSKGKGGSMHMIDKSVNFIGSTPILASIVPIACGTAFEQKYNKKKGIAVAFFGDGAFEEGIVPETINLAALFKLPLLLVVENNLFAVNSKLNERRSKDYDVEMIVKGFGGMYIKADGNDYDDVFTKAQSLVKEVRAHGVPAVLECITFRHMAHSAPIFDENYREEDPLEKRQEQDSLKKVRMQLIKEGVLQEDIERLEMDILRNVHESIQFAKDSAYPETNELYTNLYA